MKLKRITLALALTMSLGAAIMMADDVIPKSYEFVKVYEAPSTSAKMIGSVARSKPATIIAEEDDFYEVKLENGTTGFVFKGDVECTGANKPANTQSQKPKSEPQSAPEAKKSAPEAKKAAPEAAKAAPASAEADQSTPAPEAEPAGNRAVPPFKKTTVTVGKKTYDVADIFDERAVYKEKGVNKENVFFVISKQEFRLYVYEKVGNDTVLVAHYPVCYAKRTGQKTKSGDMSTPETDMQGPFRISQIAAASSWTHDFKDGRGAIKAYGDWFMRLDLSKGTGLNASVRSNRSIGIHGSSGNRESVPGNDSEGCIRLRDEDLRHLKSTYAQVGTKVVVKPYTQGKYKFEQSAEKALGTRYVYPVKGYKKYPAK